MRFIHSSDLQIGMVFNYFEPEAAALLQDARHRAVRILGELAVQHGATVVLLAGDIYDKEQLKPQTLAKPMEVMRQFPGIAWHLIPGNHDHARENGLWDRLRRLGLPANVRLHTDPGAVQIADGDGASVFLLPAPLRHLASNDDLTAYMDREATPAGVVRIGIAHGSVQNFGSDPGETRNPIAPDRAEQAGLAYLALGDWHRQLRINARTWYSGTPEPDQFKLPPDSGGTLCNGGSALLVDIAGVRAIPVVEPVETGTYRWHQVRETLSEDSHIDVLEARLRGLDPVLGRVVLDLRVTGTLSLAGRKRFGEAIIESGVGAAVRAIRLDEGLVLEPTGADMDDIDRPGGFIRDAAERLRKLKNDHVDRRRARLAELALRRLYLEHLGMANQ
ncbi:MAG: metallophosphoesterase family protein [Stellaceae bacterium]